MRSRALLALSLPLAAAGTLAGHAAGYLLVGSTRTDAAVHGYLAYAPAFVGVCVALAVVAVGLRVAGRLDGSPSAWPYALLPPLAFCAQETIERLAAGLPAHAVLAPAVYAGLAAQAPVAVATYLLVRALLRVADEARRSLAHDAGPMVVPGAALPVPRPESAPIRLRIARTGLGRAPPR